MKRGKGLGIFLALILMLGLSLQFILADTVEIGNVSSTQSKNIGAGRNCIAFGTEAVMCGKGTTKIYQCEYNPTTGIVKSTAPNTNDCSGATGVSNPTRIECGYICFSNPVDKKIITGALISPGFEGYNSYFNKKNTLNIGANKNCIGILSDVSRGGDDIKVSCVYNSASGDLTAEMIGKTAYAYHGASMRCSYFCYEDIASSNNIESFVFNTKGNSNIGANKNFIGLPNKMITTYLGYGTGCDYNYDSSTGVALMGSGISGGDYYCSYLSSTCSKKQCSDYLGQCGTSLEDGCGGYVDCSSACGTGQCVEGICRSGHVCSGINQSIIQLSKVTASNGTVISLTDSIFNYSICYNEIFGTDYSRPNANNCNGKNNILFLNANYNSLASTNQSATYNTPVCYGNLICRNITGSSGNIGLVAYYTLDGNANDASGNGNNGIVNEAALTTGKVGQAYNFDGVNDYISIANPSELNNLKGLTVSAWIKPSLFHFYNERIIDKGYNSAFSLNSWDNQTKFVLWIGNNGISEGVWTTGELDNNWHHIVATANGTILKIYVDGVLNNSANQTISIGNNNYPLTIGADMSTLPNYEWFNGSIDEVKILNRELTPAEIQQEYQRTTPGLNSNENCAEDENLTLRLSDLTNALISNANDINYPIKICCKPQPQEITGANWTNMNDIIIDKADLKDSVKAAVGGLGFDNQNISYDIYKDVPWWFDKKIAQTSTNGYLVWNAGLNSTGGYSEGTYYFKATFDNGNTLTSTGLVVGETENDSLPKIKIIKPIAETNYIINPNTNKTVLINFEQISSDEDDDLNITWDFGDGYSSTSSACITTGNCNATYNYNKSGTKMIRATAKEMTRVNSLSASDVSRIFVYKEGLNIFAIIDSPPYNGAIADIGTFLINGTSSHVANCSSDLSKCQSASSDCYTITDNITLEKIYCYKFADSSNPNFGFQWTFDLADGGVDKDHTNSTPFYKAFVIPKEHPVNLKVNFTF